MSATELAAPALVEEDRADVLRDVPPGALRRLAFPHTAQRRETERERFCGECTRWVTVGRDGVEHGHVRGAAHGGPTCPDRPSEQVDPKREVGRA